MKTLYSIYVISVVALLTAVFAIMHNDLRHRMSRVVASKRPARQPRFPFGAHTAAR